MLKLNFKNRKDLNLSNLVLDYNGTLAFKGKTVSGVKDKLSKLSEILDIYIVTADTFGTVRKEFEDQPVNIEITDDKSTGTEYKKEFVTKLGNANTIVIGNGANDRLMLENADLSIAIIGGEGASLNTVLKADIVIKDILEGLDLLLNPESLKATLRR
ncbi:MAG: HAD family hydrolase [Bacillota bacterium]